MLLFIGLALWFFGFRSESLICFILFGLLPDTLTGGFEDKILADRAEWAEEKDFREKYFLPWVDTHRKDLPLLLYLRYRFTQIKKAEMVQIMGGFENAK